MGSTPPFPVLGSHCRVNECSRVDFVPFCDARQQILPNISVVRELKINANVSKRPRYKESCATIVDGTFVRIEASEEEVDAAESVLAWSSMISPKTEEGRSTAMNGSGSFEGGMNALQFPCRNVTINGAGATRIVALNGV